MIRDILAQTFPSMFIEPRAEHVPIDKGRLFGREAPLIAEIGTGSGYFLESIASEHPDVDFAAAERHSASVRRVYNRIRKAGLSNVRVYHGEGTFFLRNLLPPASVAAVYLNFPDPWPKAKDRSKRLFHRSFFGLLAARLEADGTAYLTTDHHEYFERVLAEAETSPYFRSEPTEPPPAVLETRYASKWRERGRTIHHAEFHLQARADVESTIDLVPMQHSVLSGRMPDFSQFESIVHSFDDNHVIVKRVLQPLAEPSYLFDVHIEEEGLTQDILLRIRARDDPDTYVLGVAPFGHPLATRGVSEAVAVVTEWFVDQGLTVVHTSY